MANENAELNGFEFDNIVESEYLDFDELEAKLRSDLDVSITELEFLKKDRQKIGDPENLGNTVMSIVWEQFINQVANTAGEDFIRENNGLTLDLRDDAHIQTTENFKNGKIATHNDKVDYQNRYDDYQSNFQKDENGNVKTKIDPRSNKEKEVLTKDARKPFDNDRDTGSASVHKDHTIPAAEIIRDSEANCHLSKDEQVDFANSDANLCDMDSAANQSKGDSTMTEWLESERNGETPAERFNIDKEKCEENDRIAREEYEKRKEEGKERSKETGKKSQREEAFRIAGKALRAVVMQLLAELTKEVIRKLIAWLKLSQKNIQSLVDYIKSAFCAFWSKIKNHLINAGSTIANTVASAILGPIARTITKTVTLLKQGFKSVKEAFAYINNPENKDKPFGILMLEVGKIVIAGISAAGALVLGEVIEKGLMAVPVFLIEIPFFGSLASVMGLFFGGLVSGIVGAIAINLINKAVAEKIRNGTVEKEINKSNEVLSTQNSIVALREEKLDHTKKEVANTIFDRHMEASDVISKAEDYTSNAMKNMSNAMHRISNSASNISNTVNGKFSEDDCKIVTVTGNESDFDYLLK
jgi:gas vesicle protein